MPSACRAVWAGIPLLGFLNRRGAAGSCARAGWPGVSLASGEMVVGKPPTATPQLLHTSCLASPTLSAGIAT